MTKEKIRQLIIKAQLKTINKILEVKNMKGFSSEKLNIERLKPKAIDIELNKCTHLSIDEQTSTCTICGKHVSCNIAFDEETDKAIALIIDKIESLKMVMSELGTSKELKIAQPYFNMIPLLNNLESLQDVVVHNYSTYIDTLNQIHAEETAEFENDSKETFIKALALEDEDDESEEPVMGEE